MIEVIEKMSNFWYAPRTFLHLHVIDEKKESSS